MSEILQGAETFLDHSLSNINYLLYNKIVLKFLKKINHLLVLHFKTDYYQQASYSSILERATSRKYAASFQT